jgi:putative adenylate-forming enzyme
MNKFEVLKHFVAARWRLHYLHGQRLEAFQNAKINQLLSWVGLRSSFYREHWQNHSLKNWQELPRTNKVLMMQNFSRFNTLGISEDLARAAALEMEQTGFSALSKASAGFSSGTSGYRGLFVVSEQEQAMWAGVILSRVLHEFQGRERVALFLRANNKLYETVRSQFIEFKYFDLGAGLDQVTQTLNAYKPTILIAPPSKLEQLGLASNRQFKPKKIISVAEILEPHDKSLIEDLFQQSVHQIYQATEGLIAVTCSHGQLHLQEDIMALQLEPMERGRFTPIITDLWRKTQPIICYELGDIWQLGSKICPCGCSWRVIDQVEGRVNDVIELNQKHLFPSEVSELLRIPEITDFQVIQEHPNQLHFFLSLHSDAKKTLVEDELQEQFPSTNLSFEYEIPARISIEKRRRVQKIRKA